jgi:mannose-6-phosphate isomerase-like protein (cupin superfamily)
MRREQCHHLTTDKISARLPGPNGERFVTALSRGSLEVELYQPIGRDPQQPHTRDEAYVVVGGNGTFFMDDERVPFGPGDFLFVPAGVEHRFEDFGETLIAWVMFFGPEGGETPEPEAFQSLSKMSSTASGAI